MGCGQRGAPETAWWWEQASAQLVLRGGHLGAGLGHRSFVGGAPVLAIPACLLPQETRCQALEALVCSTAQGDVFHGEKKERRRGFFCGLMSSYFPMWVYL